MIYDCNGIRGPQFPADGTNCTVDATGKVLSPLSWCDTETGEACRYLVFGKDWVIGADQRVVAVVGKYPAPLKRIKITLLHAGNLEYAPYNGAVLCQPLQPNHIDKGVALWYAIEQLKKDHPPVSEVKAPDAKPADCPVVKEGQA